MYKDFQIIIGGTMRFISIYKLIIVFVVFILLVNIHAQETNNNSVKFILSEDLVKNGFNIIDFSIRTSGGQFGNIRTYIGFSINKPLPDFVINAFDKENHFLFQIDEYDQSNSQQEFKNMAILYHSYIWNVDLSFIKTIVIEKEW